MAGVADFSGLFFAYVRLCSAEEWLWAYQIWAGFASGRDSPGCTLQYSHDNTLETYSKITGLHMVFSVSDFSMSVLFIAALGKHSSLRSLSSSEPWEFIFPSSCPTPKFCLGKCLADVSVFLFWVGFFLFFFSVTLSSLLCLGVFKWFSPSQGESVTELGKTLTWISVIGLTHKLPLALFPWTREKRVAFLQPVSFGWLSVAEPLVWNLLPPL